MKRVLGGKRFRNNDEVIAAVQSWIHKQPKTFFETGIKKLPERWHKCMAVNRDYIEKQRVIRFHFIVNKFFKNEFSFNFEDLIIPPVRHVYFISLSPTLYNLCN
jgi:hypothetical protein